MPRRRASGNEQIQPIYAGLWCLYAPISDTDKSARAQPGSLATKWAGRGPSHPRSCTHGIEVANDHRREPRVPLIPVIRCSGKRLLRLDDPEWGSAAVAY